MTLHGIPLEKATRAEMLVLLNECARGWAMSRDRLEWRLRELRVVALMKDLDKLSDLMCKTSCMESKYWDLNRKYITLSNQLDKLLSINMEKKNERKRRRQSP